MIPCPDHHIPGIICATCEDLGRYEPGRCTCGVLVQREAVQLTTGSTVWRYCYPGDDWIGFQPWVLRCRGCMSQIEATWMPGIPTPTVKGATTNVREV